MIPGIPLLARNPDTPLAVQLLLGTGLFVTLIFIIYVVIGTVCSLIYRTERTDEKADNVKLAMTTIASESVRPALTESLNHLTENFGEFELYCIIDEGSDLQEELVQRKDIQTVIVPDNYESKAEAKGRAINYFIEEIVEKGYWYGFIDDDNLILDDEFLYEIPYYEERGYGAMNPVLVPRPGRSTITFLADHIRTLDDMTVFRVFTGLFGVPYMGFHGELLCARGDLLKEITFDRPTIVEDFAFAMELSKRGYKTWQSRTYVSVLSPHSVKAFFKQRRRWFLGILEYLPRSPWQTKVIAGPRMVMWTLGLSGSWIFFPLWLFYAGLTIPRPIYLFAFSAAFIYAGICLIGAYRLKGWVGVFLLLLVPICALIEHLAPWYALLKRQSGFIVIDK